MNEEALWCNIYEAEFLRLVAVLGTEGAAAEADTAANAAADAYLERFENDDTDEAGA